MNRIVKDPHGEPSVPKKAIREAVKKQCPFCPTLERLTEWLVSDSGIVVCIDLHKRKWDSRLLAVRCGKEGHKHWNDYSKEEKGEVRMYLRLGVVIMERRGYIHIETDEQHFENPEHGHIQACFKKNMVGNV